MHGQEAVQARRGQHRRKAGGNLHQFLFFGRQVDLGAQDWVVEHGIGHLAEDVQDNARTPAQVMPVHAGVQEGTQHAGQGSRAEDQPAGIHAGEQVFPGLLRQRAGGTKLVVVVDGGLSLTHRLIAVCLVAFARLRVEALVAGKSVRGAPWSGKVAGVL